MTRSTIEDDLRAMFAEQDRLLDNLDSNNLDGPDDIATDIIRSAASRGVGRRRLVFAAAAAVIVVSGLWGIRELSSDRSITAADNNTAQLGSDSSHGFDQQHYVWPARLPEGWSITRTTIPGQESPPSSFGVIAAAGLDHRRILLFAIVGASEAVFSGESRVVDGVEYSVLEEGDGFVSLHWQTEDLVFTLEAWRIDIDEAIRIATSATATSDSESATVIALDVSLPDDFDVLVDQQPFQNPTARPVVFRLSCPETEPGQGCALILTVGVPLLANTELQAATWLAERAASSVQTQYGEVFISSGPVAESLVILDSGLVLTLGDAPGQTVGPGHSPLTIEDIETVLAGLQTIDQQTYTNQANSLD